MKPYRLYWGLALLLLIFSCEDQFKVKSNEYQVTFYNKPQLVNSLSETAFIVSARVTPFTFSEMGQIAAVINITNGGNLIHEADLHDDGALSVSGDISKNDGVFTVRILPAVFPQLGSYDISARFVIGEKTYTVNDILTVTTNIKPLILSASFPDTLFENDQSLQFELADDDGINDLESLTISFYNDSLYSVLHRQVTDSLDNMEYSFYNVATDSSFGVGSSGKKWVRLTLWDKLQSDTLDLASPVYFVNSAPVIREISMPDSVQIPSTGVTYIYIRARVFEPRGLLEIQEAYFNVGNNKIGLFDDGPSGGHGDNAAGDGIFSAIIVTDSNDPENTYQFDFYAVDILGQSSPLVSHQLILYH